MISTQGGGKTRRPEWRVERWTRSASSMGCGGRISEGDDEGRSGWKRIRLKETGVKESTYSMGERYFSFPSRTVKSGHF